MLKVFAQTILKRRQPAIRLLNFLAYAVAAVILLGGVLIYTDHSLTIEVVLLGADLGKISLLFYIITLIPGIFRRFKIAHPFIAVLTTLRRQFGILAFLFAFGHFFFMRGALQLREMELFSFQTFELFGMAGLFLITPLFLTSNDFSVKTLGKWWKKIHQLTYIALGAIFLHVLLQDISIWSILIGAALIAEIASGIYSFFYNNKNVVESNHESN